MRNLPSGAVTFLFTDIEGSTAAWEARPERMAADVELHDRLVREAIESNEGFVFATGGDSFSAAFNSPSSALAAAMAGQRRLDASDADIAVRMGIYTGEAVERDGNYFGPPLNRAARLMSLGHGGQILVSPTTRELAGHGAFSFVDLGEHRLADLGEPIRVFQLNVEGLRGSFPALRSVVATNNLPFLGEVFGRESDIEQIAETLSENRLVTLVGAGGIGKTTLAIATAARLQDSYEDGCWLVDLTDLTPGSRAGSVASAVSRVDRRFSETAMLAPRHMLMIFDNCEHVLTGVSEYLEELLAFAPTVSVVATTREALPVPGQMVLPVEPLSTVRGSDRADAVDLFVARAKEAGVDLAMDTDRDVVVDICESLGGLPLGIELAAARTTVMTVAEIAERLADRLSLLRGKRGGPVHHQTIEATIAWSYDLLDHDAKQFLRLLSVFEAGFDLEMAEAVGADDEHLSPIDLLGDLVRKSLVQRRDSRFEMLEAIRQFANLKLSAHSEAQTAHERHFGHFATWAKQRQELLLRAGMPLEDRQWVSANIANLRAAVKWGADNEHLTQAAEISWVLWVHYRAHRLPGRPAGEDWYEPLIPHLDELEPEHKAGVLHQWSIFADLAGDRQLSRELLEREHRIYLEAGRPLKAAGAANNLGLLAQAEGESEEARAWYQTAIDESNRLGVDSSIPLTNLATMIWWTDGQPKEALDLLSGYEPPEADPVVEWGPENLRLARAEILTYLGNLDEATEEATRALEALRAKRLSRQLESSALLTLAHAQARRGDFEATQALVLEAFDELPSSWQGVASWGGSLSLVRTLLFLGHPDVAVRYLELIDQTRFAVPSFFQAELDEIYVAIERAVGEQPAASTDPDKPIPDLIVEALQTQMPTS